MINMQELDWLWWPIIFLWPFGFLLHKRQDRQSSSQALFLSEQNALRQASVSQSFNLPFSLIWWLIWTLCIVAAARPVNLSEHVTLPQDAREWLIAIDVSGSMQEEDMFINNRRLDRLSGLKYVLDPFIAERQGDQIGLILFGSQAYLQAPMTPDLQSIRRFLAKAEVGIAGRFTAIGDAIGLGLLQLRRSASKQKIMILATDGENTAGEINPIDAAKSIQNEVKIYTIGIGEADEKTLSAIADATEGQYFYARSIAELKQISELINQLEPVSIEAKKVTIYQEYFYVPLLLAALLILVHSLFTGIRHAFV